MLKILNRITRASAKWVWPGLAWSGTGPDLGHGRLRKIYSPEATRDRNVLLISLDTTRADHLNCYGYDRPTTPNIDAVAVEGIVFERAVAPAFPDGWFHLARIATEMKDGERAETCLTRMLDLEPDHAAAHCNLGSLYLEQDRLREAGDHCRQSLEVRPDYPEAHDILGSVLARTGKASEAMEHLRRAVEIDPDNPQIHNNLANLHLSEGGGLEGGFAIRLTAWQHDAAPFPHAWRANLR